MANKTWKTIPVNVISLDEIGQLLKDLETGAGELYIVANPMARSNFDIGAYVFALTDKDVPKKL